MIRAGQSYRAQVNKMYFLATLMQSYTSISLRQAGRPQPENDRPRKQQLFKGFKAQRGLTAQHELLLQLNQSKD